MISHALTCSPFSATLYFHIFSMSNRQIPRISVYSCRIALSIPLEVKTWHQTMPVHPPKANLSLPAMKHKKNAVTKLTWASYRWLHKVTWNHRSGKYVRKHLCVLFEMFPKTLHSPEHNKCITKLIPPVSLLLHWFSFETHTGTSHSNIRIKKASIPLTH